MQTTPKANNILGHFFALLGAVVMLAIGTWVSASSSQQVQPLDNLAVPRTGHTATALSDGRILITGGRDAAGNLVAASEIFDPETQTSSAIAALHTARVDHSATVLADGRVLVAGGTGANGALSSSEIFDPGNPGAGFQVVASPMTAARTHHTATLLNNGSVLIAGGETGGTAEIFDPTTQSFTPTLWNLQVARNGHTATLFTDDSVLLAGGNTNSMELFTPLDQKFTLDVATMSVVRTGHWAFELSDTRLLLFQGDTGNSIDEFNPVTDTITPKGSLDFHASSSSLLANGKVLVLGTDVSGLYNPDAVPPAPDFTAFDETSVPNSGILPRSGQSAVQFPGDKKILITGGVDANNQLLGQALFNPAKIWTDKDDYQPEEPVILSGSGWKATESIYLFAVDNETEQWTYEMTVPADANGEFILSPYFIVELRHLGVQFHVTALGAQSTMQSDVYFTDSNPNTITLGAQTPNPAPAGTSATYSVLVGFTGNNNPCTVNLTLITGSGQTGLPAGATFAFSPSSVTNTSPSSVLTINVPAGTTANPYTFTVRADPQPGCQNIGNAPTFAGTLVVGGTAATTTTVASSSNPSVYGNSVTFTATVTSGSGTPTGSVTFYDGACGGTALTGAIPLVSGQASFSTSSLTASGSPHTIRACYTPSGSFGSSNGSVSQTVNKANATVVVTPYNVTYDGSPHTATVTSITGVNGETGATVGTVALNTTHTNAGTYSSDTWSFTGTANYNNIAVTTITDVINKATPTATLAVTNSPQTYTGSPQAATVGITVSSVPGAVANILTGGAATKTNAGTYAVTADFVPTDTANYNTLTAQSAGNFIINKATPTATLAVTNSPQTYTGSPQAATVGISVSSVPGTVANILTGGAATKTNAGTYAVTADFVPTDTANYNSLIGQSAGNFVIDKATPTATLAVSNSPVTYDGSPQAATVGITVSSVPGAVANILTGGAATKTNAGTYAVTADFVPTDTANYNSLIGQSAGNFVIDKATPTATLAVSNSPQIYTSSPQAATVGISVSSVPGTVANILTGGAATKTNAGTYAVTADFVPNDTANYNSLIGQSAGNFVIDKATPTATLAVSNSPVTYDGSPQAATVGITVSSVPGAVANILTGGAATKTNAGTYAVTADFVPTDTTNYNTLTGLSAGNFVINKANATFTVTPYDVTYDTNEHTASVSTITGVGGETGAAVGSVDVSNTTHTNAGTYAADYWTFTGTANYNNIAATTITDQIDKANAMVVVDPYSVTYDTFSHTATVVSITGVGGQTGATVGTVDVSNTTHTNAGTYAADYWTFTGTANYNSIAATTITDQIDKANAMVVVDPYSVTYDTFSHTATVVSITGVGGQTGATVGTVDVSNTTHTNAGTYAADYWTFTGTANYNSIAATTITDQIDKANAMVVVDPYSVTYDTFSHTATVVSITGVGGQTGATVGTVDVSNTTHTNAGTYAADYWTFTGTANYNSIAATTITDQIDKANAMVVVDPYSVTYDTFSHTATVVSITGVGGQTGATVGTVDVSNTTHTNAGTYAADYWTFTGTANYNSIAATTITDQIDKANAMVVVDPYSVTYDTFSHTATVVSITGVGGQTGATVGTVDVSNTVHTAAGTYAADYWFFTGTANYNDIGNTTITDQIDKANAMVVVNPYSVTYDGNSHTATVVSITGVNGETGATVGIVDVSNTVHTAAGTYAADYWFFTGTANYNDIGNTTITDQIDKANAMVVVNPYSVTYDGNSHTATYTVTGVGTDTAAAGSSINVSGTTHTGAGTYDGDAWSFNGGANYNNQSGTVDDFIGKANATVVVTAYSVTFDANPHTATYTITGVGIDTAAAGSSINVTGTTHTGAGTYNGDAWSFNGGANYNNQSGTVDDFIGKATATVVVTAYSVTFDANPHTATYTVTGVGIDTGAAGSSINVTGTTHTNAGTYNGDPWSFTGGANYNNQNGTVNNAIAKANATVVVTAYNVTYNGMPRTATYTVTGVGIDTGAAGSSINVTGTTHTNAGTYNGDAWSFNGGTNYNNQNGTVNDVIGKANATFTVTLYNVSFDNNPHTATVGPISGVNGETGATVGTINLSGTTHTLPADYPSDPWTFTGTANYNNQNGTVHDIIHYGTTCTGSDPGGVILPPINSDGTSVYKRKGGSTIPVKFKVCDANGNSISNPYAVFLNYPQGGQLTMTGNIRGTVEQVNETGETTIPDVAFTFTGGQWHFNMDTGNLTAGNTYTFRINLAFGPGITFTVGVK